MIGFRLNGKKVSSKADPTARLIDVLREELGDTSVKEGCGEGECGACSILLDGKLANSCILPVIRAEGSDVVTIAGVMETPRGKRLVEAFAAEGAVQCGFSTPGLVIASEALLEANPSPSEEEIRVAISGNLCRCTGYDLVVRAIAVAAAGAGAAKGAAPAAAAARPVAAVAATAAPAATAPAAGAAAAAEKRQGL